MNTRQAILGFLLLGFFSCTSAKKENKAKEPVTTSIKAKSELPIHINLPEKKKDDLKASFFADSVVYIPLETKEKSLLRVVTHVRMNDSIIAISDMRKILLFRHDGTFIRQIGHRGKGPGEYGTIANFHLKADTIYIASRRGINKYTLDGKFQGDIRLKHPIGFFTMFGEDSIVFYNEYKGEIYFYDLAFNLKDTLVVEKNTSPDRSNFQMFDPADAFFQISKNKLLFTNYKSDTIWNLVGKKRKPEYVLNLKDKLLPWDKQVEYFKGDFNRYKKEVEKYQKVNLKEISDHLFLLQKDWAGKVNTIHLHNFKDNTTEAYNAKYINDDILGGIKLRARLSFSTENALVTGMPAHELTETLKEENQHKTITGEQHNLWKKRMSKVKFDDNPILVLFKLKK